MKDQRENVQRSTLNVQRRMEERGLELLYWTCRCHGFRYCYPGACMHTDESNLIPSHEIFSGGTTAKGSRK